MQRRSAHENGPSRSPGVCGSEEPLHGSRVVVTGGAGFVGSHLAARLVGLGCRVVVVDDMSTGDRRNLEHLGGHPAVSLTEGSILDRAVLHEAMEGAAYVFHHAAIASVQRSITHPLDTHEANVTGTLLVLEAARRAGVRKVVVASSAAVYGDTEEMPVTEEAVPHPLSPYASQKLAAEAYCAAYTVSYGLPCVALRYFNVYGPRQNPQGDYAAVIPAFIRAASGGMPLTIFGSGSQTRDFVYVADVVSANVQAAATDVSGVFNIGSGREVSVSDLAALIRVLTSGTCPPQHAPGRESEILRSVAAIDKAATFGWKPETSLEEGLRRTTGLSHAT